MTLRSSASGHAHRALWLRVAPTVMPPAVAGWPGGKPASFCNSNLSSFPFSQTAAALLASEPVLLTRAGLRLLISAVEYVPFFADELPADGKASGPCAFAYILESVAWGKEAGRGMSTISLCCHLCRNPLRWLSA